ISALTREGCEHLVKTIYQHVQVVQKSEQTVEEVDPRFAELPPEAPESPESPVSR
ncbi:MAG: GTPase ObgE, partial [Polaromonas sp.]